MALSRTMMPSFQELVTFEAASRLASFTKASEELSLTQSAVSKQVRQLENTLGVTLFNRSNGGVILTVFGEQYMRTVRRILAEYETAAHAMFASSGSESALKIATLPTFASRWLIPRIPAFLAAHPLLTINIVTELKPFDFDEKPVDIAIHYGASNWAQAEVTFLCDEAIIAVMSPGYSDAHGLRSVHDLHRAVLLQHTTRPGLWTHWFNTIGVEHPFPHRGPMFDQFSMASEAAVCGMGVALVPSFFVENELERGILQRLDTKPVGGTGSYYAAVPLRHRGDALVNAFVDWIVQEANGRPRAEKDRPFRNFSPASLNGLASRRGASLSL